MREVVSPRSNRFSRECSGVVIWSVFLARWFGRYECAAAIVRPDHYVFGVSTDAPSTVAMLSELSSRLQ